MNRLSFAIYATMMMAEMAGNKFDFLSDKNIGGNKKMRRYGNINKDSWEWEHLPKKIRKGKSPDEIKILRKEFYTRRTGIKIDD